jgi:hypothetical protein
MFAMHSVMVIERVTDADANSAYITDDSAGTGDFIGREIS